MEIINTLIYSVFEDIC